MCDGVFMAGNDPYACVTRTVNGTGQQREDALRFVALVFDGVIGTTFFQDQ